MMSFVSVMDLPCFSKYLASARKSGRCRLPDWGGLKVVVKLLTHLNNSLRFSQQPFVAEETKKDSKGELVFAFLRQKNVAQCVLR